MMERDAWLALVFKSGKGLYKKGVLGREVHEFEIKAAMKAQSIYADAMAAPRLEITHLEFVSPDEGSTYRSLTEPIHRTIREVPDSRDSGWVNVWHSVAEAAFLSVAAVPNDMREDMSAVIGKSSYLAYCRECRDWIPTPPQFGELSFDEQCAWVEVELKTAPLMARGFAAKARASRWAKTVRGAAKVNGVWNERRGYKPWRIMCGNCGNLWTERLGFADSYKQVCPNCGVTNEWGEK